MAKVFGIITARFIWLLAFAIGFGHVSAAELTVFAAASLTDALKEIAAAYQQKSGDKIYFNFGASSTLARQIEEGAPADIFFSADNQKMDRLGRAGLIQASSRIELLSNSLVVVVSPATSLHINSADDLKQVKSLALADPQIVPAGIYAKKYLEVAGLWSSLKPRVIPTENVRATLSAVESGNVDAGIVYKTDAMISRKVRVAYAIPAELGPKIVYPIALTKEARNKFPAAKFLDELKSEKSAEVFRKYGFLTPSAR